MQAGLTPGEALQTATRNPAEFLGMADSLGTIAVGKIADLVLLNENPLLDIKNTREIAAVVANGRLITHEAMDDMLRQVEASATGE